MKEILWSGFAALVFALVACISRRVLAKYDEAVAKEYATMAGAV